MRASSQIYSRCLLLSRHCGPDLLPNSLWPHGRYMHGEGKYTRASGRAVKTEKIYGNRQNIRGADQGTAHGKVIARTQAASWAAACCISQLSVFQLYRQRGWIGTTGVNRAIGSPE